MSTETGALMVADLAMSYGQASALRAQGRYEAGIQRRGAALADVNAEDILKRGEEGAQQRLRQARALIGQQRTAIAGQGLRVDAGTPLALQEDTAAMGALDADTIRLNAFREAWGMRMEALDRRTAAGHIARGSRFAARQALGAGFLQTGRDYLLTTPRSPAAPKKGQAIPDDPSRGIYGGPDGFLE